MVSLKPLLSLLKKLNSYTSKPRPIIQSQALIVFFMCLIVMFSLPFGGVVWWAVFGVCPRIVVPFAFCLWVAGVVCYVSLRVYFTVRCRER